MPVWPLGTIELLSSFMQHPTPTTKCIIIFFRHEFCPRCCGASAAMSVSTELTTQSLFKCTIFVDHVRHFIQMLPSIIWLIFWACKLLFILLEIVYKARSTPFSRIENDSCRRMIRKWYVKLIERIFCLHMHWQWRESVRVWLRLMRRLMGETVDPFHH